MASPLEHAALPATGLPPLQAFGLPSRGGVPVPVDGIVACELPQPGCLWLRGHADDAGFRRHAGAVLGVPLPLQPQGRSLFGGGSGAVLRMSSDEWLLVCRRTQREPLLRALRDALLDVFAQVVDTSAGMASLRLAGPRCLALQQRLGAAGFSGPAPDGHPGGNGTLAGTVMSRASVIVLRTDVDGVLLVFQRSFANHVWRLIEHSAEPFGLCITAAAPGADLLFAPLIEAA